MRRSLRGIVRFGSNLPELQPEVRAMSILRTLLVAFAAIAVPLTAQTPDSWDGLTKIRGRKADALYLLPGADFRTYTKVQLDPTEVAFRRNYQRDYNRTARGLGARLDNDEVARIAEAARSGFEEIFADAFRDGGYQVVTEPGPDVVRIRTGVLDLYVSAPDQMQPGRTRTYSAEAGQATVFIEVRDSLAGTLLGRAVDQRVIDDDVASIRNRATNRADFEEVFRYWARASVRGLDELKARSPLPMEARARR
jgi:Protein of unknown function (DUF3313)